jgi:CubicO group peptidase (beta-lactamase class C family)
MKDTSFSVPAVKLDRLATSYWTNPESGALGLYDEAEGGQWSRPPAFPSGGGGLVSTIDDYLAFGQMMLDKGKHGNERVLSRPSVEAMTTDQLTPEQKAASLRVRPVPWRRAPDSSGTLNEGRDERKAASLRFSVPLLRLPDRLPNTNRDLNPL